VFANGSPKPENINGNLEGKFDNTILKLSNENVFSSLP
jgi:hypothetical protein